MVNVLVCHLCTQTRPVRTVLAQKGTLVLINTYTQKVKDVPDQDEGFDHCKDLEATKPRSNTELRIAYWLCKLGTC